ncbi:hexosaminidase [Chitinophaga ginsengisegetis]|uniref:beta-N-acetylhexosaminidase n=1 Tax=Chitinophaga ginsengisegetis TaxID=393003 RepID=A0A1T5N711_9BACT|nr:beta-N-acetylhexosaminidase [Chitinophaga ginsengisegetis]SKC96246.1 hexosaminidase [Chitinophaga ginsengisegetis]
MKKCLLAIAIVFTAIPVAAQQICPVIPLPVKAGKARGSFEISAQSTISWEDTSMVPLATWLQQELLRRYHIHVPLQRKSGSTVILLEKKSATNIDAYTLIMNKQTATISGGAREGVFNGIISLLQLAAVAPVSGKALQVPCWNITDAPLYAWRGVMLDESRYFFGKEKVKSVLDWMAFYKLNRFHWHLTDMPGWRLEIKKYPLLTTVGGIGNISDPNAPAAYYTQNDIREIVAYAKARCIDIIPEIDMPGHAGAANRAYPAFDGGGTAKYPQFTFNPGREGTYSYLADILTETAQLFPAQLIHLGGDEVTFGNAGWDQDTGIIRLKEAQGLKDRKQVEDYFIQRMADTVLKLHNKVMAWDEIATASLPADSTIVCWWRHEKPENLAMAFQKGYSVVLCPRLPFYFDFVQDSSHKIGRRWKDGEFNPLQSVYDFSAAAVPATRGHESLILGVQACLWSETIHSNNRLDFLLFPRIAALAETAWTQSPAKDFNGFKTRLKAQLPLYAKEHLYYFDIFQPAKHQESGKAAAGYID